MTSYEQQKADKTAFAARIPGIAAELSKQTCATWLAKVEHKDMDYWLLHVRHADGAELSFFVPWGNNGNERVEVSPVWPRSHDGQMPYIRDTEKVDKIGVTTSKSDKQIATDIARRLLPGYWRTYALLLERTRETDAYHALARATADRLIAAIGARYAQHDDNSIKGRYDLYAPERDGLAELRVSGDNVRMVIDCKVDRALAILLTLPLQTEPD